MQTTKYQTAGKYKHATSLESLQHGIQRRPSLLCISRHACSSGIQTKITKITKNSATTLTPSSRLSWRLSISCHCSSFVYPCISFCVYPFVSLCISCYCPPLHFHCFPISSVPAKWLLKPTNKDVLFLGCLLSMRQRN